MKKATPKKQGVRKAAPGVTRKEAKELVQRARFEELSRAKLVEECLAFQDELEKTTRRNAGLHRSQRQESELRLSVAEGHAKKLTELLRTVRNTQDQIVEDAEAGMKDKDGEIATLKAAVEGIRMSACRDPRRITNMLRSYRGDFVRLGVDLAIGQEGIQCTKAGVTVSLAYDSLLHHGVRRIVKMFEALSTPEAPSTLADKQLIDGLTDVADFMERRSAEMSRSTAEQLAAKVAEEKSKATTETVEKALEARDAAQNP